MEESPSDYTAFFSFRKIVILAGISLSGAKARVQRGRGKIKEMLMECCHFEFDRSGKVVDYIPKSDDCNGCGDGCK